MQLNSQQQAAVEHVDGPLLVLAGAGSGKTHIVTSRIVHLLNQGVAPHQILAVTFTNKAAGEMKERVQGRVSHVPTICTFHSLGVRILRQCIDHLHYSKDFTIYDEEDSLKLIKVCMEEAGIQDREIKPKFFKQMISGAKNRLESPDDLNVNQFTKEKEVFFPGIYAAYQRKMRDCQALDFDDLLYMTVHLFRTCPLVLDYYQKYWHYLLIDEYQDTNAAQYEIARLLVEKSGNIFVVGDPDQSIYSWRGADINNILGFEQSYPHAKVVHLEQNYRSRASILNAANELIRHNENRYDKNLWSDLGEGDKITVFSGDTDRGEANFVIEEMQKHLSNGIALNEMVLFYRTNAQSRVLEDALLANRIPYVIVGGISFYQRREIKDVLAYLRMVHSGADFVSFFRTINLPKRGLGTTTIAKLRRAAENEKMGIGDFCEAFLLGNIHVEGLRLTKKQKEGLLNYTSIIAHLRDFGEKEGLSALLRETVRQTGYLEYLRLDKETCEDRMENVNALIAKASEWEGDQEESQEASLGSFLEELSLKTTLDEVTAENERVSLMTIHNGKGLEFSVTFLLGMEEDLFPHANARGSELALEEERRLCYVGMTRAKEFLYMTSAKTRYLWNEQRVMRQSRFIAEIPAKYLKRCSWMCSAY